ncbi:acyl-CoA dehydrogenase family protein [Thermoflavimicrobium dichotomicum]|uniref:Acyl-CoA dehydrogenase n=1 Tax=Thermoflavimicrobium dichotomicum TaxID=46223 RepID=A0A1I3Q942_9BACL|nr:acyl-CoA dehydrogenase family protein [Thermoflavimicrobium dichotomicum]SFJ30200.1 Acyl-CoA dehydrogenase [Thermoflavimicrobium dichotomicum]
MIQPNMLYRDLFDIAKDLTHVIRAHVDHEAHHEHVLLNIWPHLVKVGFHRLLIESRFGGLGLDLKQYMNLIRLLAYGDGALALAVHVHNFAVKIVNELGNETLQHRLKTWLDEGKIFALARSEYGRDYRYNFSTRISQIKSSMILNGQKDFCTLAGLADYYLVFAQTEVTSPSMDSVQVCIANGKNPTVEVIKSNGLDSMVSSSTYSVRFNHYELTPAELVGQPGEITRLSNPDILTLGICAINIGMADLGIELFTEKERQLYASKNAEVLRWLGRMDVLLRSTELLLNESINSRPHSGIDSGVCLRRAKAASDMLIQDVTEGAIHYLGIDGIMSKNKFIYLRNNSYATRILPPNTQKCLFTLGTEKLK